MSRIIIIGAGHNGLVCALYLARNGHEVSVYERAPIPGGCTVTEEFYEGFKYNTGAIELEGMLHSGIIEDLELNKYGLKMITPDHLVSVWVGDESVHLHRDLNTTLARIEKYRSKQAAKEWKDYAKLSDSVMGLLGTFQHVKSPGVGGLSSVMGNIGALGEDNEAIIQTMLAPATANLDMWLSDDCLRGAAMAYATHPQLPPWVPGTGPLACLLGSSHGGTGGKPVGGTGMLITALMAGLKDRNVDVHCNKGISKLIIRNGRIAGVKCDDGDEDMADIVISTIDIKRVSQMCDPDDLPEIMKKGAKRAHCGLFNVGEIKIDCALSAPPEFINEDENCTGSLRFLLHHKDSYIENFRRLNGGEMPDDPPMMMNVPSIDDPTQAPDGKATLWLSSFVPAQFYGNGRKWPEMNEFAAEKVMDSFERFAPGTKKKVLHMNITGPSDWEERTGNPAGNPNHIDMTVDQMFSFRPVAGLGYNRTPIKGFYLSGPSTHPGGGAHGMPGMLTANTVIDDIAGKPVKKARPSLVGMAKSYFKIRKALG